MTSKATIVQQDAALKLVAEWLGTMYGDGEPMPTGKDAAYRGLGPELVRDFDGCLFYQPPTPAIILEGLPGADWAIMAANDEGLWARLGDIGVWVEPVNGVVLNVYRKES